MAKGRIEQYDVISKAALDSIDLLGAKLKLNLDQLDKMIEKGKGMDKALSGSLTISELNKTIQDQIKLLIDLDNTKKKTETTNKELVLTKIQETQARRDLKSTMEAEAVLQNKEAGSLQKLVAENKKLTLERKSLNLETEKGRTRLLEINTAIDKNTETIRKNLDAAGKQRMNIGNYKSALEGLGSTLKKLAGALGITAGIALIGKAMKEAFNIIKVFQLAQSELQSVSGKTAKEIENLTIQAKLLGSQTQYTATEVTKLQVELAKLGFTTTEIELSTKAILSFATATGAALPDAAKTAGTALRVFNADASRMNDFVATLAVATTKSALTFADYDTILSTAGPVAKAYGFTLEDLIGLIGKLKDAGFDASKGATALRNIFLNLADTNGALAKELGGTVTNSNELIKGLVSLRERGVSLNETLQLTDKRSVAAFNVFLNQAEAAGTLRDSITGVNDELQVMVDKRLDNLAGDVIKLSSAWEGFVLKGEAGFNLFRKMIQFINNLVISLSNLDLIFTRTSKLSAEQITRTYDAMLARTGKQADKLRIIIGKLKDQTIESLAASKEASLKELDDIGFNKKQALVLYEEFIERRKVQIDLESRALADAEKARLSDLEKAELTKKEIAEKGVKDAEKAAKKANEQKLKNKKVWDELEVEDLKMAENALKEIRDERIDQQLVNMSKLNEARDQELAVVNQSYLDGVTSFEKAEEEKLRIARKYELLIAQESLKALEENVGALTPGEQAEGLAKIAALKLKIIENLAEDEYNAKKYWTDLEMADLEESEDAIKEIQKEREKNEKEAEERKQELIKATFDLVNELGDAIFEISNDRIESEINSIEKKRDKEIEAAGENKEAQKKINDKYDKEVAVQKKKQAENDKLAALFNIALNTAVAIMKVAPNPILIALTAGLGIIQAAVVLSKKIPEFRIGTKDSPGGPAIIGEEGRELLIDTYGGVQLSPERASLVYLKPHTQIIPAKETDFIMRKALQNRDQHNTVVNVDMNPVVEAIKNKREYIFNFTDEGIDISHRDGDFATHYRNNFKR